MQTKLVPALAALAALTLASCATSTEDAPVSAVATVTAAAGEGSASAAPIDEFAWANPDAPDIFKFTAVDLVSGDTIDGTSLLYKDVVMWFWASWCPICSAEAGAIVNAMPDFPDDVYVIGIGGQSSTEDSQTFVADHPGVEAFPHIYDESGQIWKDFGAVSQPTLVLINQDGQSQTYAGGYGKYDIIDKVAWLGDN